MNYLKKQAIARSVLKTNKPYVATYNLVSKLFKSGSVAANSFANNLMAGAINSSKLVKAGVGDRGKTPKKI